MGSIISNKEKDNQIPFQLKYKKTESNMNLYPSFLKMSS